MHFPGRSSSWPLKGIVLVSLHGFVRVNVMLLSNVSWSSMDYYRLRNAKFSWYWIHCNCAICSSKKFSSRSVNVELSWQYSNSLILWSLGVIKYVECSTVDPTNCVGAWWIHNQLQILRIECSNSYLGRIKKHHDVEISWWNNENEITKKLTFRS